MTLDDDARIFLPADRLEISVDPTGSTVEIEIDGTRYPMAWVGSPVQFTSGNRTMWRQGAKTTYRFCGSNATAVGTDVKLTTGTHAAQILVTLTDGQVVPGSNQRIEVQ